MVATSTNLPGPRVRQYSTADSPATSNTLAAIASARAGRRRGSWAVKLRRARIPCQTRGGGRIGLTPFASCMRFSSQKRQRSCTSSVVARHFSNRRRAGPRNVPSTYSAARESMISGWSCGVTSGLQALAQALQPAPDPTLDGTQRVTGQPRDFLVRVAPHESELEATALVV